MCLREIEEGKWYVVDTKDPIDQCCALCSDNTTLLKPIDGGEPRRINYPDNDNVTILDGPFNDRDSCFIGLQEIISPQHRHLRSTNTQPPLRIRISSWMTKHLIAKWNFLKIFLNKFSPYIYIGGVLVPAGITYLLKPLMEQWFLELSIPFPWILLLISACFLALGISILHIWCPHIIKSYNNFGDFRGRGTPASQIINWFLEEVALKSDGNYSGNAIYNFKIGPLNQPANLNEDDFVSLSTDIANNEMIHLVRNFTMDEVQQSEAFQYTRNALSGKNLVARMFCTFFGAVGSILIIYIIGKNIFEVIKYLFTN